MGIYLSIYIYMMSAHFISSTLLLLVFSAAIAHLHFMFRKHEKGSFAWFCPLTLLLAVCSSDCVAFIFLVLK